MPVNSCLWREVILPERPKLITKLALPTGKKRGQIVHAERRGEATTTTTTTTTTIIIIIIITLFPNEHTLDSTMVKRADQTVA